MCRVHMRCFLPKYTSCVVLYLSLQQMTVLIMNNFICYWARRKYTNNNFAQNFGREHLQCYNWTYVRKLLLFHLMFA